MMQRIVSIFCCLLVAIQMTEVSAAAQQNSTPVVSDQTSLAACRRPCLEDGTPVKLRIAQTVSSADAHVDDRVEFEVLEEIRISDVSIVPKGAIALGTVTEAQPKRRMARGGKLEIVMDSVRLADGEKAALRATKSVQGGGHTGAMTAGIVATALILWPAAPFFLFMHGKDITIPKGTEIPTFVSGNFPLDLAKFQQNVVTTAQIPQANSSATVSISSSPTDAEISVDQNFVGNTPSSITVLAGKHLISVTKQGYKDWDREITLSGGTVSLSADLVPGVASPAPALSATTNAVSGEKSRPPDPEPLAVTQPKVEEETATGWIGITTKDDFDRGVVITRVLDGGAAATAGLRVGDVIVKLNGAPVKSGMDFDVAIAHSRLGSQMRLSYMRGAWISEVTVTVGKIT
ncbi:MAG: PDZ domain-containing protein [Candidatus Acidiferrales bacterium]